MRATFPLGALSFTIKRRTSINDGRTVWANVPAEYWESVVQDGDEIRAFSAANLPVLAAGATKARGQWEGTPATLVYRERVRLLLLADTYKVRASP